MVTGSEDKTARLWALPQDGRDSPKLLRTLRVPIGEGDEGKVTVVDLSPDGKLVAAGGWDAKAQERGEDGIYIFEAATGRLVTRLGGLSSTMNHLAFSPDGSRLAAAVFGSNGVRMWDTIGWQILAEDKRYGGKAVLGIAFDSANRLYTVAWDGLIRRYGVQGKLEAKTRTLGGKEPYSIAVHPQDAKFAIGFNDTTAVEVYDARSLKRLYAADTSNIFGGNLANTTWSTDGARLYAGGEYPGTTPVKLLIWQDEGRGERGEASRSQNIITHLLPCGEGIAVGAGDPAFGLVAADGAKRVWQTGVTADLRDQREIFAVSAAAKKVRFTLKWRSEPVQFDLDAFSLSDAGDNPAGLLSPGTTGLDVRDWQHNYAPKLNGKTLALDDHEISRSLAVAPDANRFVLGTEYWLRAYRANGREIWKKAIPGPAWGVNISGNSKFVVAAYGDGTIRWQRLSDGQELLALFVHAKDRRYIAWTPKGYYAASPGAEDLIGWHVNRDWGHAPDFFPASRFRDQFNRPDIVKRVLGDLDEDIAIDEANRLAGSRPAQEIAKQLPPVIAILSPGEGGTFASNSLALSYSLRSPSGLAISEVVALVDGRPLAGAATKGPAPVSATDDTERSITLSGLPQRDLTLSLVARAGDAESTPASIRLKFKGAAQASAPADVASTVSLYALIVGVSKFKDPSVNSLNWAAKDARDFAAALKRENRLYRKIEVKLLTDVDAESGAILDGLTWLKRQVGQGDVGVVFLAGHGVTDPSGDYYYVPYNARIEEVAGVPLPTRGSSVPDIEFSRTLKQLAGNALFFFDTCHAGKAAGISFRGAQDYNKLINEIAGSANAIVLASSTGAELSLESDEWRQGAFTKALLEGLAGAADVLPKDGVVTVDELNLYVKERVKELTGGLQHPVDLKPKEARNIAFAMVP